MKLSALIFVVVLCKSKLLELLRSVHINSWCISACLLFRKSPGYRLYITLDAEEMSISFNIRQILYII